MSKIVKKSLICLKLNLINMKLNSFIIPNGISYFLVMVEYNDFTGETINILRYNPSTMGFEVQELALTLDNALDYLIYLEALTEGDVSAIEEISSSVNT